MMAARLQAVFGFLRMAVILGRLRNCWCFRSIRKKGIGSRLLQLAKGYTPTMLYFGAQPGLEG